MKTESIKLKVLEELKPFDSRGHPNTSWTINVQPYVVKAIDLTEKFVRDECCDD